MGEKIRYNYVIIDGGSVEIDLDDKEKKDEIIREDIKRKMDAGRISMIISIADKDGAGRKIGM